MILFTFSVIFVQIKAFFYKNSYYKITFHETKKKKFCVARGPIKKG